MTNKILSFLLILSIMLSINIVTPVMATDDVTFSYAVIPVSLSGLDKETAIITSIKTKTESVVTVPEEIDGYDIIALDYYTLAFDARGVKTLNLPKTIRFFWSSYINDNKVSGKSENDCLFDTNELENIYVDEENPYFTSIDGVLFSKDSSILLKYPKENPRKIYAIPEGVMEIGYYAFEYAQNIEEIVLPNTLNTIDIGAFSGCENLIRCAIPNGVEIIGENAFHMCENLQSINIPKSVSNLYYAKYYNHKGLGLDAPSIIYYAGTKNEFGKIIDQYGDEFSTLGELENVTVYYLNGNIGVFLNGEIIEFDVPPTIEQDRTLVGIRAICEALGFEVAWDDNTKTVTIYGNKKIEFTINSNIMEINDVKFTIDVPAMIKENRTLVPLRALCESLGAIVTYDDVAKIVFIEHTLPYNVSAVMAAPKHQRVMVPLYANGENMWRYNELNIFGEEENAQKFFERVGAGASLIAGSKAFMGVSKGNVFVSKEMEEAFYDAAIAQIISVDETILASSAQNSIEAFLDAKGDQIELQKNFGNIEKMYKAVFGSKDGFGVELVNRDFDEILNYFLLDNLSESTIDAVSKYLTIMSMYDAYTMTGDSFKELLDCMENDGYEKEFVSYAKEKIKLFNDKEALVINTLKDGADKSLKNLISKTIKEIGKNGVKTGTDIIGKKLDISDDIKKVFSSSSVSSVISEIGAKTIYALVVSSPVVKSIDNYFVLELMKAMSIYSSYYFDKEWEETIKTHNFYSVSQQKKVKNLAIVDIKISKSCFDLLMTLFEIQKDPSYREYINKTKSIKTDFYDAYFKYWYTCAIAD